MVEGLTTEFWDSVLCVGSYCGGCEQWLECW